MRNFFSQTLLLVLAMALAFLSLLTVTDCVPRPVPDKPPLGESVDLYPPTCAWKLNLSNADLCVGMFTREGRPCAACPGAAACVEQSSQVYCVSGSCLADTTCEYLHR